MADYGDSYRHDGQSFGSLYKRCDNQIPEAIEADPEPYHQLIDTQRPVFKSCAPLHTLLVVDPTTLKSSDPRTPLALYHQTALARP